MWGGGGVGGLPPDLSCWWTGLENWLTPKCATNVTTTIVNNRISLTIQYNTPPLLLNKQQGKTVVKTMMVTANKATLDVIMPAANEK